MQDRKKDTDVYNRLLVSEGEGEGGMIWENGILTCILSCKNWKKKMDWLVLFVGHGTLKNILQHHSSKASILLHSAFFTVQLFHPYMTTGKNIALTRQTLVDKVMSLLLNILSRLVITFLPRSKQLLISWLQSPSAVILELQKIKSATVSTVSPSISHEVMGPDAMIFVF